MTALKIAVILVLALFLLSLVRLGALVEFDSHGLAVKVKLGPFRFAVFPGKPREKRAGKGQEPRRKKKAAEPKAQEPRRGGALTLVKEFLPLAADAAGRVKRTIRIDTFFMDLTMAAPDPALAAMSFGGANAVLGTLWPLVEQNFEVKDWRLRTAVDFEAQAPAVWLQAAATLTIGQAVSLGIHLAFRALGILRAHRAAARAGQRVRPAAQNSQKEAV